MKCLLIDDEPSARSRLARMLLEFPDLEVIGTSPEYPRALEMVRDSLDERIRERLRKLLLEAASDPDARVALAQYFHTTGFAPIDASTMRSLRDLQRGVLQVKDQVE